jgi:SAM-dependent methyltransferase
MPRKPPIRSSADEWRAIAKGPNLLYHIYSTPQKQQDGWTEDDFYASGRDDWAQFLSHWRHYEPAVGGSVVEIGCGAGRLTAALTGWFATVDSLDVSEDMIARARAVAGPKATFHQVSANEIPLPTGSRDAVFSVHVLQHLDDEAAIQRYLNEAFRVLRPGGTVMVHIMLGGDPLSLPKKALWEAKLLWSRFGLSRGREHTAVRMVFPMAHVAVGMMRSAGFTDVELRAFSVRSTDGIHSFFLGRKPG